MMHRPIALGLASAVMAGAALWASPLLPAQAPRSPAAPKTNAALKPTPHLPDGTPDLNGTYFHEGGVSFVRPVRLPDGSVCFFGCPPGKGGAARGGGPQGPPIPPPAPSFPSYKPEYLAKVKDLSDRQVQTDTALKCQPPGVPRIGPPSKIVHTPREVVLLYDDISGSFFRVVPIDGRSHRQGLPASYLGDAIGKWESDTLVVETVNFNDDTWLLDNGAFHTKDLRVVERFRRVGDTIQYQAISYDPAVLVEPWSMVPQLLTITDQELEESPRCEDRDVEHIVDGSHHDNAR
jgi:hypothetical protein